MIARDRRQQKLFVAFLALSLLLHLLLALFAQYWSGSGPSVATTTQPPLEIDLRQIPVRPRELDLPTPPAETARTRPAKRLAADDRQVPREQAPAGTTPAERPSSRPAAAATRPAPPAPAQPPVVGTPQTQPPRKGALPASPPALPLEQLLASSSQAARNIAADHVREWQQKLREEVERGEAIWLDTEKDLLVSFFKRFRDGIYLVWHYPQAAVARGQDGTCLLKITINRAGIVEEVQLINSSGHTLLDDAAVAAVHNATRYYGYLPASYTGETLTIFAFFQYQLGGRPFMYGVD